MRDTFIFIGLVAAFAAGYWLTRGTASHVPASPAITQTKKPQPKGVTHEGQSHAKNPESPHSGEGEGAAVDVTETAQLHSIYEKREARQRRTAPAVSAPIVEAADAVEPFAPLAEPQAPLTAEVEENRREEAPKVVHGVPVAAWTLSRRDSLPMGPTSPAAPEGVRVFLQCMELKKGGPQSLAQSECQALAYRELKVRENSSR